MNKFLERSLNMGSIVAGARLLANSSAANPPCPPPDPYSRYQPSTTSAN